MKWIRKKAVREIESILRREWEREICKFKFKSFEGYRMWEDFP